MRERAGCFTLIVFLLPCGCLGALLFSSTVAVVNYSANHVYCRRPGPGHLLN